MTDVKRTANGHCPIDPLNATCEKFFQIWSHKAANISNELVEYTIRRMQSDRLRLLFRTRNEFTQQENLSPICQMSMYIEDDLQRIKEHIRRFCLSTRNVYRHLRSDSRIYPKMSIELDQGIMIKICRFIFKTKVLIKILSKEQQQQQKVEELNKYKIKQTEKILNINDPYRNITKAFIVLQSNFEILFGDILDRDFFQNAKTAVQTLPIILDTSKTIRLIFCALYKLSEPERQLEAELIRQRRLTICDKGLRLNKQELITMNIPVKNQEDKKLKTIKEMLKVYQSEVRQTSTPFSQDKSPTKTTGNSPRSQLGSSKSKSSKTNKARLSPSPSNRTPKKIPSKTPKTKNKRDKSKTPKKSKNRNASTSLSYKTKNTNSDQIEISNKKNFGWTTWLHNATLTLASNTNANLSKPLLTTWASVDRITKI